MPFASGIQECRDTYKEEPVLLLKGKKSCQPASPDAILRITAELPKEKGHKPRTIDFNVGKVRIFIDLWNTR